MPKGITPVVAVILLLLITIAIVGFAAIFFQRTAQSATQAGEQQLAQQVSQAGVLFSVESVSRSTLYIRNHGTAAIAATSLAVFVDNSPAAFRLASSINPNEVGQVRLALRSCKDYATAQTAKVTAGASEISVSLSRGNGIYNINPGSGDFDASCDMTTDGGGWTIVYAATGADNEVPLVSNEGRGNSNPLAFEHYNILHAQKMALSSISTESIFVRNNGAWMKANHPLFDGSLSGVPDQHPHWTVTVTANDGATASNAQMGYSNYNNARGGDFGITTSGIVFDHHSSLYWHLRGGCGLQYLYSYSFPGADSDAGYDVNTALGSWSVTNLCDSAEGGGLVFYAAMR